MIEVSQKDLLRAKLITPGFYDVHIEKVTEALSAKGDSTNHILEGTVICNTDDGSEQFAGCPSPYWLFNSKAPGFFIGFYAATHDGAEPSPGRFDIKAAEGTTVSVFIANEEYEGRMVNKLKHQYKKARTA